MCTQVAIKRQSSYRKNKYIININLNKLLQSAYKRGHSTETGLVRVKNGILMSIDQDKPVILILLDLSAAFDTVLYNALFSRLKDIFKDQRCTISNSGIFRDLTQCGDSKYIIIV